MVGAKTEDGPPRGINVANLTTVAVAAALLGLVWWALPRQVQGGDAGEFATVMLRGGVPHPSGYPWMRMLGLFARGLETLGVSPVIAAALPPAMAGALGWVVLSRLFARWSQPYHGLFAVLFVASSSLVVVHTCDSEVWGPQLFFVSLFLWHALGKTSHPAIIGLTFGAAASHHLTSLLLAPLAIASVWSPANPARANLRDLAWMFAAAAGMGAVFTTLAVGSSGAWHWGDTRSVAGLVHHVLRFDYGFLQLSLHTERPEVLDLWGRVLGSLGRSFSAGLANHPLAALAVLALLALGARPPSEVPRHVWWSLYLTLLLTTLVFPARHNIDPNHPFGAWILERFDIQPLMLWTVMLVRVLARLPRLGGRLRGLSIGLGAALVVAQLLHTTATGYPRDERAVEAYATDLLRTPASNQRSLVIGTDDHRTFPVLFMQEVKEEGPSVLYVDAQLLHYDWYRARLRQRWPEIPAAEKPLQLIGAIWRDPKLRDTPVYLANVFSRPAREQLRLAPEGVLWRVIPPHADPAWFELDALAARHVTALRKYTATADMFVGLDNVNTHPWSSDLWYAYVDRTTSLVRILRAEGKTEARESVERAFRHLMQTDPTAPLGDAPTPSEPEPTAAVPSADR